MRVTFLLDPASTVGQAVSSSRPPTDESSPLAIGRSCALTWGTFAQSRFTAVLTAVAEAYRSHLVSAEFEGHMLATDARVDDGPEAESLPPPALVT